MLPAMSPFARLGVALPLVWAGAVLWAYGLVLPGTTTPNESYWQRDLRWAAVFAVCATFLWLCRGRKPYLWFVVGILVAWLGTDVWLDRTGVTGWVPVAVVAAVAASVAGVLLARGRGDGGVRSLTGAAAVCSLLAPSVLPTAAAGADGIRLLLSALLVVVTATCALSASPASFRIRIAAWVAVFLWYAGAATGLYTGFLLLVAAALLLAGVWLVTREWHGWQRTAGRFAAVVISFPVVGYVLFIASWQWGRPLTALAGRTPVEIADADVVVPLTAAFVGIVYAIMWSVPWRRILGLDRDPKAPRLTL